MAGSFGFLPLLGAFELLSLADISHLQSPCWVNPTSQWEETAQLAQAPACQTAFATGVDNLCPTEAGGVLEGPLISRRSPLCFKPLCRHLSDMISCVHSTRTSLLPRRAGSESTPVILSDSPGWAVCLRGWTEGQVGPPSCQGWARSFPGQEKARPFSSSVLRAGNWDASTGHSPVHSGLDPEPFPIAKCSSHSFAILETSPILFLLHLLFVAVFLTWGPTPGMVHLENAALQN